MPRFVLKALKSDVEVLGDKFRIDGSDDIFIVHASIDKFQNKDELFIATHLPTGFKLGWHATINGAMHHANTRWNSHTPEQRAKALAKAYESLAKRDEKIAHPLESLKKHETCIAVRLKAGAA